MEVPFHPAFKLNGQSFSRHELLLWAKNETNLQTNSQKVAAFIQEWLSLSPYCWAKSSGSTGVAKQMMLSKAAMIHSAHTTGQFLRLMPYNTALCALPTDYISGKMMLVRAITLGLNLYTVVPSANPFENTSMNFDFCALTPMQAQHSVESLYRVKKLILGGSSISNTLEEILLKLPVKIWATYGMTETVSHIALREIGSELYTAVNGVKLSTDQRNCLVINAPKLVNAPLHTNDVVKLYNNTQFKWLGRYDNIINSGGIKINPENVEEKLSKLIKNPYFIGKLPDNTLGEKLILIVEGYEEQYPNLLKEISLSQLLEKYQIPKEIYFLPQFCYTPTGKIQREQTLLSALQ